jgi:hypothetical protein
MNVTLKKEEAWQSVAGVEGGDRRLAAQHPLRGSEALDEREGHGGKSRLDRLVQAFQRLQSGLSSTDQEYSRIAGTAGFADRDYDFLNSPETMDQFLKDARSELRTRVRSVKLSYPDLFKPARKM